VSAARPPLDLATADLDRLAGPQGSHT